MPKKGAVGVGFIDVRGHNNEWIFHERQLAGLPREAVVAILGWEHLQRPP
jgi:hypothetical protein